MFERFTREARMAVVDAQGEAVQGGEPEIDALHLLTALLRRPGPVVERLLADAGTRPADLLAEIGRVRGRAGVSDQEARALEEMGVDVEQILSRIQELREETAGIDLPRPRRRWFRGGDRQHRPFAREAKQSLEQTLREALDLRDDYIGLEHLLLALLHRGGPAADVLTSAGLDYLVLRRALIAART
ncbi:Clp protease N-terminal domain-containing protein [Amycolatopsis suaedae]|uniref:ATPase n=1 Tax=Amycolatopsis suaedae TaxID=2510978 RepID=A0A4Q7JAP2_9PSEU|nr:Clp protease N-terminal domain-containing protein [Amycolatopsis suaedae]RZQ64339.1 ATPase [Amycolatopsis suaedae]